MHQDSPQIQQLKSRYKASLPEKSAQIAELQSLLQSGQPSVPQTLKDIHEFLHKLAGSAGMYDYDDIAALARASMQFVITQPIDAPAIQQVGDELGKIRAVMLEYSD